MLIRKSFLRTLESWKAFTTSAVVAIALIVWEQLYSRGNFVKIFADQSRGVEEDLKNTINVVGNFVMGAEALKQVIENIVRLAQHENEAEP